MPILHFHQQYSNVEDCTFTQRRPQWNKSVRICDMRTLKTLKPWAWQPLPLSNLELPHYCLVVNLATISCKLQPEFRRFYFQLCKHKPIYVLSTRACEEGVQSCLHVVHYISVRCSGQVWRQQASACGRQGWGYLRSRLLLPWSCTHAAAIVTRAGKEAVQWITRQHLVYREWKFSTDVGVFFCIH